MELNNIEQVQMKYREMDIWKINKLMSLTF